MSRPPGIGSFPEHVNEADLGPVAAESRLAISWLEDDHECDTCGFSYASGAHVRLDGKTILELLPTAVCFDGDSWTREEVFRRILVHLGLTIQETDE